MFSVDHFLSDLAIFLGLTFVGGRMLAIALRRYALRWTWALLGFPLWVILARYSPLIADGVGGASLVGCFVGARWHASDLAHGRDLAEIARSRLGMTGILVRFIRTRQVVRRGWVHGRSLIVGRDECGYPVSIPVGEMAGSHVLVLGATGSGKTVSQAWIAGRLIAHGHGAIVIDPKGDEMLRNELQTVARLARRPFLEWTPEGPYSYNPYASGSDSEIADKALAGEVFTEPHYLRLAQRYLGHAVRTMRAAEIPVTVPALMAHLQPDQLEVTARALPEEQASVVHEYLDSLVDRQRRDLAGARDRLSILAESDVRHWFDPDAAPVIDLRTAVASRAVVYFALDSDRRPLLAQMVAAALVSDLVTLAAHLQNDPLPTVVLIDEFSAVAAKHVARLFGRARSAGISLLLATQELADLHSLDGGLRDQVLGNVETVIAHRQNVPGSAETIAKVASSKPVWVATQQTEDRLIGHGPAGRGSRRRDYDYEIHPSRVQQLYTGQALVITPGRGQRPAIAQIHHPAETYR
jgi:conjugal transfer pilus assembly protein TraD